MSKTTIVTAAPIVTEVTVQAAGLAEGKAVQAARLKVTEHGGAAETERHDVFHSDDYFCGKTCRGSEIKISEKTSKFLVRRIIFTLGQVVGTRGQYELRTYFDSAIGIDNDNPDIVMSGDTKYTNIRFVRAHTQFNRSFALCIMLHFNNGIRANFDIAVYKHCMCCPVSPEYNDPMHGAEYILHAADRQYILNYIEDKFGPITEADSKKKLGAKKRLTRVSHR